MGERSQRRPGRVGFSGTGGKDEKWYRYAKPYTYYARRPKIVNYQTEGQLFLNGKGANYGAWIDYDDDGNARDNGKNSGNLIENPAGIIEYIARYAGLKEHQIKHGTSGGAATNSFDLTIKTTLSTSKFIAVVDTEIDWIDSAHEIAVHCGSILIFDNQNRLIIKPYKADAVFTQGASHIPGDSDIFSSAATKANYRWSQHPIIKGGFAVDIEPKENVVNEVFVNYYKHFATGKLQKATFITGTNSDNGDGTRDQNTTGPNDRESVAAASALRYNVLDMPSRITVDSPFILNSATAVLLRNHIFDRRNNLRYICVFSTWLNAISVERGDIINIRHPDINAIIGNRFIITDANNDFQMVESVAGDIDIILDSGLYTGAELATEFKTKLDTASARTYTVSYSTSTYKFTFAVDTGTIFVDYSDCEVLASYIGFEGDPSAGASIISTNPVYEQRKWYVRRTDPYLGEKEMEIEAIELV